MSSRSVCQARIGIAGLVDLLLLVVGLLRIWSSCESSCG